MIHAKLPCTYTNFFSDAQLEDENPNLHPSRRAILSCVRLPQQNTLPFTPDRLTVEEDVFGDDEASDSEDPDDEYQDCEHRIKHPNLQAIHHGYQIDHLAILARLDANSRKIHSSTFKDKTTSKDPDDDFWDCEHRIQHPNLQTIHHGSQIDHLAILVRLDANSRKIQSSTFKDKITSKKDQGETSDYSESDFTASTASEGVESPSSLATPQDLGTEATSVHDLFLDVKGAAIHPLMTELESITLSENKDTGISFDDDSLFAQYSALLPSDKMPEKYQHYRLKLTKRFPPPFSNRTSIPYSCYRIVDFVHSNDFSEVVVAQLVAENGKDFGLGKGRMCCIKIYRNVRSLPMPENIRPELKAETKAYQRLSEAARSKQPGLQFLMQLQTLLRDESRTFLIMDVMNYPLYAVIEDLPWALNRVQETKRLVAQMALGLAALHSIGIIHRDFKPDNVLIDYRGNVRIADFGSSKISDRCMPYLPGRLYTYAYVGTWPYIAPEVLENKTKTRQIPYGIEVDYWSLGCIIFELESLHGEVMFDDRAKFDLWCSLEDDTDKQNFLQFGELSPRALSLICGLVHSDVLQRFGFYEIIHHPYFGKAENSEFYYAQDRALRRTCEGSAETDVSNLCMDDNDDEPHFLYI